MLYHRDVYLPEKYLTGILGTVEIRLSNHAIRACLTDRHGLIVPPKRIEITTNNVIEIEIVQNTLNKVVVRIDYDEIKDLVMVLHPDGFCRTVWFNQKGDNHRTLGKSVYAQA